jgi:hypothetical protein
MERSDRCRPRPRVDLAEPSAPVELPFDTSDLAALYRAYHRAPDEPAPPPTAVRRAQICVARGGVDTFHDRTIQVFVDDEEWGRLRYDGSVTREVAPGRHRVRVFNSLFSSALDVDVRPGEHVRFTCGNGFPRVGYLLMFIFHVTYLRVRLERDTTSA